MGFPLGTFPTQAGLRGEWRTQGQRKIDIIYGVFKQITKRNLLESESESGVADFPDFIIIESLEKVCLAKLSLSSFKKLCNKG